MNSSTADFSFNIQTNQPADYVSSHPYGKVMMTQNAAEFIRPLLISLGFKDVTISEQLPENCLNLSMFRKLRLNFSSGDLRSHYYELVKFHLQQNFSRNIFTNLESNLYPELNDKVLLIRTLRYNNAYVNLNDLKHFKNNLLFIGLKSEHETFTKDYFDLDYLPVEDALDLALKMKSAKGVIRQSIRVV